VLLALASSVERKTNLVGLNPLRQKVEVVVLVERALVRVDETALVLVDVAAVIAELAFGAETRHLGHLKCLGKLGRLEGLEFELALGLDAVALVVMVILIADVGLDLVGW
jgi:hypothetical protein